MIAFLLRFMDSFMIYTEPFVLTGGGPGNSTTFMSIDLVKIALGQFDLGPAAALSIVYPADPADLLGVLHGHDQSRQKGRSGRLMSQGQMPFHDKPANPDTTNVRASNRFAKKSNSLAGPGLYILFLMLPIYWLINMSFKTNQRSWGFSLFPQELTLHNYTTIFTDPSWYMGYINSLIYV
jgi:ABC-type sugar transport system permease subunit